MAFKKEPQWEDPIYEIEKIASATECTGLIPAAADTEEEARNYAEMYAIHPVKAEFKNERTSKRSPGKT